MAGRLLRVHNWSELAIESNYCSANLAKSCLVSKSQLRRHFLGRHGKTPQQWLGELRLARSLQLLSSSTLSIKQVAAILKYDYPGNFSRQFKRRYGFSPSKYSVDESTQIGSNGTKLKVKVTTAIVPSPHSSM
jgi:transcriptional regulator GlxA family with amidase domain